MDMQAKMKFKSDLMTAKGMLMSTSGQIASLNMSTYPVAGDMVIIPSLPMAAQAMKSQNDAMTKVMEMLEKLIDTL
jgi:hypothetical protein